MNENILEQLTAIVGTDNISTTENRKIAIRVGNKTLPLLLVLQ